jgi:hypothetical protein
VVVFTAIQTIQHIAFEKVGCDFSFSESYNVSSKIVSFVEISNSTTRFKDGVEELVSTMKPLDYTILVVVIVSFLLLFGAAVRLYRRFRWSNHMFHRVLEKRLRNTLIAWSIFTGFLKINVFFLFVYAVQLVPLSLITSEIPAFESIVLFAVCLVVFLLATYTTRNEDVKTLTCFCMVLLGLIGYFGFRVYTFGKTMINDPFKV